MTAEFQHADAPKFHFRILHETFQDNIFTAASIEKENGDSI